MKFAFRLLILILFAIIVILVFNTIRFSSKQVPIAQIESLEISDKVLTNLSKAIQIPTISAEGYLNKQPFKQLDSLFIKAFPLIGANLTKTVINESIVYRWQGKNHHLLPILLLAHTDVVPIADSTAWKEPPFSGNIKDGFVWGRGTLDDKNSVMAILEAVELMLSQNYIPERSIYLAFGQDEEVGGTHGAKAIVNHFIDQKIQFEFILDEGLVVLEDALDMLPKPLAMIGIAEKGYLSLNLSAKSEGGHTMMPPPETSIGVLSKAINRLQQNPFPAHINGAAKSLFSYAGPEMSPLYKVIFSNLWLTEGLLVNQLSQDKASNALVRTTMAPTIFDGGIKDNILPTQANATINCRILPGETAESVKGYIQKTINDNRIQIKEVDGAFRNDPSPVSDIEIFGFTVLQRTIQEIFPDVLVSPGLVIGGTDSRHYLPVCQNIYRFMPVQITKADLNRFHGSNERISIENYKQMIRFYHQLISNSCK